jgi:hypothetical protein
MPWWCLQGFAVLSLRSASISVGSITATWHVLLSSDCCNVMPLKLLYTGAILSASSCRTDASRAFQRPIPASCRPLHFWRRCL